MAKIVLFPKGCRVFWSNLFPKGCRGFAVLFQKYDFGPTFSQKVGFCGTFPKVQFCGTFLKSAEVRFWFNLFSKGWVLLHFSKSANGQFTRDLLRLFLYLVYPTPKKHKDMPFQR